MSDLTSDQIRSLEAIRQRLLSLNASLGALRTDLATSLPSWTTLQSHSNLITSNLAQVNTQLSDHADLLASTVTFPSMTFPGRSQSDVIQMLLRTKMEPDVEEWVEQGAGYGKTMNSGVGQVLRETDRRELWGWAPRKANEMARRQKWGADYTADEVARGVENVVMGLRRELVVPIEQDEDADEDDEDDYGEEDEDEDSAGVERMDIDDTQDTAQGEEGVAGAVQLKQMPMESVHRFIVTGKVG